MEADLFETVEEPEAEDIAGNLVIRRADLARDETIARLVAEMRRVFVDAGAVDEA